MNRFKKTALATVASAALLAGGAAAAPAAQAAPVPSMMPMGSLCDNFSICTYLLNVGRYSLRIDTDDSDGVRAWNAWLRPGEGTRQAKWGYDIAGFYLPAGSCAWTRSGGSGAPKTYWGSKTRNVYVAMTDYDGWDVATYYC